MLPQNSTLPETLGAFCTATLSSSGYTTPFRVTWSGSAGSMRVFYRLVLEGESQQFIAVSWPDDADWDYFLALQEVEEVHAMIPHLLGYDRVAGMLLMTDCGETSLRDILFTLATEEERYQLFVQVLEQYGRWQGTKLSSQSPINNRVFDEAMLLWETDYFREHITALIPALAPLFNAQWESERRALAQEIDAFPKGLMHRDFQGENIILQHDEVRFIDVQGVRVGPFQYDLASLLYDPYAYPLLDSPLRGKLLQHCEAQYGSQVSREISCAALQRLMQALGAYGNLSLNKGKLRYRQFVTPALIHLSEALKRASRYPQVSKIVDEALLLW